MKICGGGYCSHVERVTLYPSMTCYRKYQKKLFLLMLFHQMEHTLATVQSLKLTHIGHSINDMLSCTVIIVRS